MLKLKNDYLEINAREQGGELTRVLGKKENTDFLWNGDKKYWSYHAPVLFPIVGKVNNNQYKIDDKKYNLNQHGLARLEIFMLIEQSDDKLVFELNSNEETLKVYPYKFSLKISYLLDKNKVVTKYEVINTDDKDIYFGIGAHPAFMCPIEKNENFDDCYLQFNKNETIKTMRLNEIGMFTGKSEQYLQNENKIDLTYDVFKNDALVFENLNSNSVTLKSKKSKKYLDFDFSGFPLLGIWTKTNYPFVCIEPWFSHGDFVGYDKDFKEKDGIIKLAKNNSFKCEYAVSYFE